MDKPEDQNQQQQPPSREISNANLFAEEIFFSDTEKILFEEDLHAAEPSDRNELMDGNPADRYTPARKLNEGGMKAIWEVEDHRTARKVAMALIQDSKIASEDDIDAFLYEARLTANLQHPNIIPIYDIALDEDGNPFFTMKSLKGKTLGEILKQLREGGDQVQQEYTRTRLLGIFLKVCNAINYAHSKGVIHLDLKPSNVIVGDFGDVHVLDWGLSTLITHLNEYDGEPVSWHSMDDVSLENGQTLTRYLQTSAQRRERRNVVGGTPGYMAPEQAQGSLSDIDFQTDIYMLGAVLYELLTLQCPITGSTVKEVLNKTVRGRIKDPLKRAPNRRIPTALAAIAMKALNTDPAERYPNVSALIRDVHQFQDGYATQAENPTFITHLALLIKRHKMAVSIIAASLLLIMTILTNSFRAIKQSERVAIAAKDLATQRLNELRLKNDYIAATAQQVAPDYVNLMMRAERDYEFEASEQALNTGLAFDPELNSARLQKGRMLLSQLKFAEARQMLNPPSGRRVQGAAQELKLAERYINRPAVSDQDLPQLVRDFMTHHMEQGIPRLFYHLNRKPFDPQTRFPALAAALSVLNPKVASPTLSWNNPAAEGWTLDIAGTPNLDNIAPLCGLKINSLNLSGSGSPNLKLITEPGLRKLNLSQTQFNHVPELDALKELEVLNLSSTRIRNLSAILKYPKLTTLDVSRIEGLSISSQLIWMQNLQLLTIAEAHQNDPTIQSLAARGVIVIYTHQ